MSEKKKLRGGQNGAANEEQPQTLRREVTRAAHNDRSECARARNQDVLPGILGKQLRSAYSELLNAPVPDSITNLIEQLKSKEPVARKGGADKPSGEENGQ